ncbi:hypothetical protein DCM91_14865 [Chitinophaga costaii]|nr:hypothetical protein DCM91_14865 [Chitinophaga costaii]
MHTAGAELEFRGAKYVDRVAFSKQQFSWEPTLRTAGEVQQKNRCNALTPRTIAKRKLPCRYAPF